MTPSKKPANERKTIAVLGGQLSRAWGAEFMAGVLSSAKTHDINVVYFAGGKPIALASPKDGRRSYGLYDLIKPGQYDGVLLSAEIGHGLSPEDIKNFYSAFVPAPVASVAIQADGISSFIVDNEGGMRAVIRHLIEMHAYKRIAFIRGPKGHMDADQRFNAYQEQLKAHSIRFDEKLVVEGDDTPESGRAAVRTLLDDRGIRMQAIVASNDRMAFGVMEALEQRGIQVPESMALTGFDDVSEAQSMGVPLTTVHQPFYETGQRAVEALLKRIDGGQVDDINIIPADLVVRWSCGCLPESIQKAIVLPKEVAHTGRLENKRDAAIQALCGAVRIAENDPLKPQYLDVFGRTWDAFLANLNNTAKSDAFLKMIQSMVELLQRNGYDFTTWQNVISTFRKYALGGISSNTTMLRAENLFQQARMLAGELSLRAQAYLRLKFEQQEEALSNFSFSIAPAMTLEAIGDAISKHFPLLGLERCFVMYYSDVSAPGSISNPTPEKFRLLFEYDENKYKIPRQESALTTGNLIPPGKTPDDHRYDAIVMPLELASNRFGFMWTEIGLADWDIYVRLKNLLASALLRTMLVQQRAKAQHEVERLLSKAHELAVEPALTRDVTEKAATQEDTDRREG